MPPRLTARSKDTPIVTDDQKEVMRHFVNSVAKAMEMYNSRVLTYESVLLDEKTPGYVKEEVAETLNADYALLWEMLQRLVDAATVNKEEFQV